MSYALHVSQSSSLWLLAYENYLQTNAFLDTAKPNSWDVDIIFYQAVLAAELHRNILR